MSIDNILSNDTCFSNDIVRSLNNNYKFNNLIDYSNKITDQVVRDSSDINI